MNDRGAVEGGFFGLLTILFIALKLMGYISWSWWWVLAPIWMPFVLILVIFVVMLVFVTFLNHK